MSGLRERLQWSTEAGAVADGPRRYLLMRPDVLMGALARLEPGMQETWLQAMTEAARAHGGDSLRSYAATVGGDADALIEATAAAAADLGWGRWQVRRPGTDTLELDVHASPFVAGWQAAGQGTASMPICAPAAGIFSALAALTFPGRDVEVIECRCAAMQPGLGKPAEAGCRFIAQARGPHVA